MTWFEKFKTQNIDELADWLDKYGQFDGAPWITWFNKKYCTNCEPISLAMKECGRIFGCIGSGDTVDCSYCEVKGKCKFFSDFSESLNNKQIIKLWLESEVEI